MTTQEAIDFFGSINKLAGTLDVWPHTIYRWGEYPPFPRQCQIELESKGQLQVTRPDEHEKPPVE